MKSSYNFESKFISKKNQKFLSKESKKKRRMKKKKDLWKISLKVHHNNPCKQKNNRRSISNYQPRRKRPQWHWIPRGTSWKGTCPPRHSTRTARSQRAKCSRGTRQSASISTGSSSGIHWRILHWSSTEMSLTETFGARRRAGQCFQKKILK